MSFSHPEIESLPAVWGRSVSKRSHTTLVDLLEVYPENAVWRPHLGHQLLLEHLAAENVTALEPPLRIIFVRDLDFRARPHTDGHFLSVGSTAHWLYHRFSVSPLFFRTMTGDKYPIKIGSASFLRRDENGVPISFDGIYRLTAGFGISSPAHVWYSHGLREKTSFYIIDQCHEGAKALILFNAQGRQVSSLLRPFAVDAFLADHSLYKWCEEIIDPRKDLIAYECKESVHLTPQQMADAVQELHGISQYLHVLREDLMDYEEVVKYLLASHQRYLKLSDESQVIDSVDESFEYLISKANTTRRWATNYAERTGIQINLFFNLASQMDSRTNLDIAKLTSRIGASTRRDSSSMITMATVTMLFLPGTFVSAFFSMVFFNTGTQEGVPSLVVGPQWWLFFVVTIPLTIFVFSIWFLWQRHRNKMETQKLGINQPALDPTVQ